MVRIVLLVALALITAVIGYLLQLLWLYIPAALLLAGAVGAGLQFRKTEKAKTELPFVTAPLAPEEDLAQLGILDIRERPTGSTIKVKKTETPPVAAPPTNGHAPPRKDVFKDMLPAFLESVRVTTQTHTVCLITLDPEAETGSVLGVVSKSPHVEKRKGFPAKAHFLHRIPHTKPLVTRPVGEGGLNLDDLGYYMTDLSGPPIGVMQVAIAPVHTEAASATFLLADVIDLQKATEGWPQFLPHFADLLRVVMEPQQALALPPTSITAADIVAEGLSVANSDRIRKRTAIIQEEMHIARAAVSPLALALVVLNDPASLGEEDLLPEALEEKFRIRLEQVTDRGRIVRFGDFTYGVFYYGSIQSLEEWVEAVRMQFPNTDADQETVSIGAAMMTDQHETAQQFRHDVEQATARAHERKACIIFE